jgi:hypothetical protein
MWDNEQAVHFHCFLFIFLWQCTCLVVLKLKHLLSSACANSHSIIVNHMLQQNLSLSAVLQKETRTAQLAVSILWLNISPLKFYAPVLLEFSPPCSLKLVCWIRDFCQHFGWFHFTFIFWCLIYINPFDFTLWQRLFLQSNETVKKFVRCIFFEFSCLPPVALYGIKY